MAKRVKNGDIVDSKGFVTDKDLRIREELLGIHAMNSFSRYCSAARLIMFSSHFSQSLVLEDGDDNIIQSGLEWQFAENTFSKKIERPMRVIEVINRYRGLETEIDDPVVEKLIIGQYLDNGQYDCILVPYHNMVHNQFGFKYKWNHEVLKSLRPGIVLEEGTVLCDSPAVGKNNSHKVGVNANVALMTIREVCEDGVVISESMAKRMAYTTFENIDAWFGHKNFPLNVYGDDTKYKPFPEIGELINEDAVVMALRDYEDDYGHALTSKKDVQRYDPLFDKIIYAKHPGSYINTRQGFKPVSRVADIKVWTCPKYKRDVYTETADMVDKYERALKRYHDDIVSVYEKISKDHYMRFRNNDCNITERFNRQIIESMAIARNENNKIGYSYRNEGLDLYRVNMLLENRGNSLVVGCKLSDKYGSKGVIVEVRPDEYMPYTIDEFGNTVRADIIMDPLSVVSRMNVGRLYEHFFTGMSTKCKNHMIEAVNKELDINKISDENVNKAFDILLGLLKIIGTEQYDGYLAVSDNMELKREIVDECINKEVYIYYSVSAVKKAWEIVEEVKGSIYYPTITPVYMKQKDGSIIEFDNPIRISKIYEIVLNKTAENFLAVSTAKVNHYGILTNTSTSVKYFSPYSDSAVKGMGETEARLFIAYVSVLFAAEIKDRSGSIGTHKHIYKNILDAAVPTNIKQVVDRTKVPYGDDVSIELLQHVFNSFGIAFCYTDSNV